MRWNQCPVCPGISVQFALESVSTLRRNQCPLCAGIAVHFAPESLSSLGWNTHLEAMQHCIEFAKSVKQTIPQAFIKRMHTHNGTSKRTDTACLFIGKSKPRKRQNICETVMTAADNKCKLLRNKK